MSLMSLSRRFIVRHEPVAGGLETLMEKVRVRLGADIRNKLLFAPAGWE